MNKPLIVILVNIILALMIKIIFINTIHAEGFPFIGNAVGKVIHDIEKSGLVLGVDGEWYDPNDTVEDSSTESDQASDADSEQEIKQSPASSESDREPEIREMFHYEMLEQLSNQTKYCTTKQEFFDVCMKFVKNEVPPYIWSTHETQLKDPESRVYQYLEEITRHIHDGEEAITYRFFQAAVVTHNTGQVLNVLDKEALMFKVFDRAIRQ